MEGDLKILNVESQMINPKFKTVFNGRKPQKIKVEYPVTRVGPLLNETKCHLVSFSLLLNQTKWHLVLSLPN